VRPVLSFISQNFLKLRPRLRMVGLLILLITVEAVFASSGKGRISHTPPLPMPRLQGEAATEYRSTTSLSLPIAGRFN
jgi:hypothetical protein